MKYYKKLVLDRKNQTSKRLTVEINNQIKTSSKTSLQLPSGSSTNRPLLYENGQIRYNTTVNDSELYNVAGQGTGWERVLTNRQHTITPQYLGTGNYDNTVFGPLSYRVDTAKPQNILVFLGPAFQFPGRNYNLIANTALSQTADTVGPTASGTATITLSTTTNIFTGTNVTAGSGLATGTTVTNINYVTRTIGINPPTTGSITSGTTLTFTYDTTGTFVQFTGPVQADPVFTLMGFDGYSP